MYQKYADIIIDISHEAIDKSFQYIIPEPFIELVEVGTLVKVPFGNGNRTRNGYVINITDEPSFDVDRMKEIYGVPEKSLMIEGKLIKLAAWIRQSYGSTMINALKTVMPVKERIKKTAQKVLVPEFEQKNAPVIKLSDSQKALADEFFDDYSKGIKKTYLLHGITGSGKTEVYIECIKNVIRMGEQAIVLIPEIALTYQTVARFKQHFGERVAVINSKQSKGEKYREFMRAKAHEADVVIGPRSALFTPCEALGLIIIDEEHDGAYKSDSAPKYHARETAIELARLSNASVILGSATPSVESYALAKAGRYRLWELKERPDGKELAAVQIVDLREELRQGNRSIISRDLYDLIEDRLNKKEQVMLFINRRGYNSFVSCRECGKAIMCPKCDVALSLHGNHLMMCHYCGYTMKEPSECPKCHSKLIGGFGTGTEKVEAQINKLFPNAKTLRMDKDTTSGKGAHGDILNAFSKHEADILIGTQMIVKGHDFVDVTLVGIILADVSLFANDYRAGERTFALLTQAAGRAGRGDTFGSVVIQTYQPDHYAIAAAASQDYKGFFEMEMTYRKMLRYPPVFNMAVVIIASEDYEYAKSASDELKSRFDVISDKNTMRVIGPSDAGIAKINNIYRRVIYIKAENIDKIVDIQVIIDDYDKDGVSILLDVNPMNAY